MLAPSEKDKQTSRKDALHNPDGVAGGKFDQIAGMGDSKVNSSIGSQWSKGRANSSFSNIKFSGKTATEDGLNVLKDIMNSKKKIIDIESNGTKTIYDKATGRGFNISREGKFNGFRDLKERSK